MVKYIAILILLIPCLGFSNKVDNVPNDAQLIEYAKYIKADKCNIDYTTDSASSIQCMNYDKSGSILVITRILHAVYFDNQFEAA